MGSKRKTNKPHKLETDTSLEYDVEETIRLEQRRNTVIASILMIVTFVITVILFIYFMYQGQDDITTALFISVFFSFAIVFGVLIIGASLFLLLFT